MDNLSELHKRLALLMQEIHKICVTNDIRYSLIGGSLIGAMRHKGFIPWDDDIDIALPWEDYKKLIKVVTNNFEHPWLSFQIAGYTKDYYNPFIKAIDNRTTFIEGYEGENPKGIFIDIFPIVCAGNTKKKAEKEFMKHRFLQSILKRKGCRFETGKLRELLMQAIGHLHSSEYWINKINKHYEECNKQKYLYSSDMDGSIKGIVPTKIFDSYKLYKFEEFEFMGVESADEYLSQVFGNYMQLPPVECRTPHHIKYINLNLPYTEYFKNNKQ